MDGLRGAVAWLAIIAEQNLPVASSQDQGGAQSGRPTANDDYIDFHAESLRCNLYGTHSKTGNPFRVLILYTLKKEDHAAPAQNNELEGNDARGAPRAASAAPRKAARG